MRAPLELAHENLVRSARFALARLMETPLVEHRERVSALESLATSWRDLGVRQRALYDLFHDAFVEHEDWDDALGDVRASI